MDLWELGFEMGKKLGILIFLVWFRELMCLGCCLRLIWDDYHLNLWIQARSLEFSHEFWTNFKQLGFMNVWNWGFFILNVVWRFWGYFHDYWFDLRLGLCLFWIFGRGWFEFCYVGRELCLAVWCCSEFWLLVISVLRMIHYGFVLADWVGF